MFDYVVECIQNNKKPSGKKLKDADVDYSLAYCVAKNISAPLCIKCKTNVASFKSIKKGFGKYCSKKCFREQLSERNKNNNYNNAKIRKIQREKKLNPILNIIKEDYLSNENMTIKKLSEKYNLSYSTIRSYLNKNELTSRNRSTNIRLNKQKKQFEHINCYLNNKEWVEEKIKSKWTSKEFSEYLKCSRNYVCEFMRKRGYPLQNQKGFSSYENIIDQILNKLNVKYERNTRKIIHPYELDFYIPSYNIAIEVNGAYWHSELHKPKNYHKDKTEKCKELGIRLLHFFDYEIDNNINVVESIINSSIQNNNKIYARKCCVVIITNEQYNKFINENHIQGNVGSSVKLGLMYQDRLVSVMSFGKSRWNKKYQYELIRYANGLNTTVVGGGSKLFQYFIKHFNPSSVISYCQNRLFTGKMYLNIGMKYSHYSPPNYKWVNSNGDCLTRYETQKHKLNSDKTEIDHMKNIGYYRVYDSGNNVYVWEKTC